MKLVFGFYVKLRRETRRRRGEAQSFFYLCGSLRFSAVLRVALRNLIFEDKATEIGVRPIKNKE